MPRTFIDFECCKGKPPALLGTLEHHGPAAEDFTQWILDPQLHTAAKTTRAHLRVSSLQAVCEWLADDARQGDAAIIGWSTFDREQFLKGADVPERARAAVEARYVNAIPIAKRWRRAFLPDWQLEANELKAYFGPTGFRPTLRRGLAPAPADWIRHVAEQAAKRGRYKDATRQAKRDWDRLLTYNEDDCRGLRHVYDIATRELELWDAYRGTTFRVDTDPALDIRIGWKRRKLDRLLVRAGVRDWAFITASNPRSQTLSPADNDRRHRLLVDAVERHRRRLTWIPGRGIGANPAWPPEESVLVLGCDEPTAIALGQRFDQLAVVVGRLEEPARLASCRRWDAPGSRLSKD